MVGVDMIVEESLSIQLEMQLVFKEILGIPNIRLCFSLATPPRQTSHEIMSFSSYKMGITYPNQSKLAH
jgi:hypothetical protein